MKAIGEARTGLGALNYARDRRNPKIQEAEVRFFRGEPSTDKLAGSPNNWAVWHRGDSADPHYHQIGEDPDLRTLRILVAVTHGETQARLAAFNAHAKMHGLDEVQRAEVASLAMKLL